MAVEGKMVDMWPSVPVMTEGVIWSGVVLAEPSGDAWPPKFVIAVNTVFIKVKMVKTWPFMPVMTVRMAWPGAVLIGLIVDAWSSEFVAMA